MTVLLKETYITITEQIVLTNSDPRFRMSTLNHIENAYYSMVFLTDIWVVL